MYYGVTNFACIQFVANSIRPRQNKANVGTNDTERRTRVTYGVCAKKTLKIILEHTMSTGWTQDYCFYKKKYVLFCYNIIAHSSNTFNE